VGDRAPARQGQRDANREAVLRALLRFGPTARVGLAQYTGLTRAAISNITRELLDEGLVQETGILRGRVGANAILLDLADDWPLLGAVHQGVSSLRVALCNLRGTILARQMIATPQRLSPETAADAVAATINTLLAGLGLEREVLAGIGVGLVGLVDVAAGVTRRAPSVGWHAAPIRSLLEARLERPVVVENNVRAMAVGEALLGQGREWPHFAFVYIGTGIGAGLIVEGQPYRGAYGSAGEVGHMTVDPTGPICVCGNRGCLEAVAAEPSLVRAAEAAGLDLGGAERGLKERVQTLALLADAGNTAAQRVVLACAESLGIMLGSLADIFNPSRIVLHGVVTSARGFFQAVSEALAAHAFLPPDAAIELRPPTFGNDAGLVGAAAVVLETLVLRGAGKLAIRRPVTMANVRGVAAGSRY